MFAGAISALAIMTILSAVFGMVFIHFIPPVWTRWVSVALFFIFGLKMLHEGWKMSATDAAEEMEEVQHDIRKREDEVCGTCCVRLIACIKSVSTTASSN